MELWDAYDKDFNIIEGMMLIRGQEKDIPEGVYHLVCHILVRHADGTYLLMQRDPRKPYPSMWEATAGGSALKGETDMEAVERELREETGIEADELYEIGRTISDETHCVYVEYFCTTDCDKDSILLQEGETVAYKWADKDTILSMSEDELLSHRMQTYLKTL